VFTTRSNTLSDSDTTVELHMHDHARWHSNNNNKQTFQNAQLTG